MRNKRREAVLAFYDRLIPLIVLDTHGGDRMFTIRYADIKDAKTLAVLKRTPIYYVTF